MGIMLIALFFSVFALAMGQALVRRKLNPYGEVAYDGLPGDLREEVRRILPDFQQRVSHITKNRDEVRVEGNYLGGDVTIEAQFDREGRLIELEMEVLGGFRTRGVAASEELPGSAVREIERVLGSAAARFEQKIVKYGKARGEEHFEVKGLSDDWKWEIAVSANGRLLEFEKEKRKHAR